MLRRCGARQEFVLRVVGGLAIKELEEERSCGLAVDGFGRGHGYRRGCGRGGGDGSKGVEDLVREALMVEESSEVRVHRELPLTIHAKLVRGCNRERLVWKVESRVRVRKARQTNDSGSKS